MQMISGQKLQLLNLENWSKQKLIFRTIKSERRSNHPPKMSVANLGINCHRLKPRRKTLTQNPSSNAMHFPPIFPPFSTPFSRIFLLPKRHHFYVASGAAGRLSCSLDICVCVRKCKMHRRRCSTWGNPHDQGCQGCF